MANGDPLSSSWKPRGDVSVTSQSDPDKIQQIANAMFQSEQRLRQFQKDTNARFDDMQRQLSDIAEKVDRILAMATT